MANETRGPIVLAAMARGVALACARRIVEEKQRVKG